MEATKPKSLFGMAKEKPAAKSKTKEKELVHVEGIGGDIERYNELSAEFENIETELELLKAKLKADGQEAYLKLYKEGKRKPESFKLYDKYITLDANGEEIEKEATVLFTATDKYAKVTDTKIEVLQKFPDLVDETRTYILNSAVLDKPGRMDAISEALMNCEALTDEDKENLLTVKTEYAVRKGTLDRLIQYKDPAEVFSLIQPVCMLKRC